MPFFFFSFSNLLQFVILETFSIASYKGETTLHSLDALHIFW